METGMSKIQELEAQREALANKRDALDERIRLHSIDTNSPTWQTLKNYYLAAQPKPMSDSKYRQVTKERAFVNYEYFRTLKALFIAKFGCTYEWVEQAYKNASVEWNDTVLAA
jgi:hypothetical protein